MCSYNQIYIVKNVLFKTGAILIISNIIEIYTDF